MDLPGKYSVCVEDRPAPSARGLLSRELGRHNRPYLRDPDFKRLGVFVKDGDSKIAAGLAAHTYGGWMFVENLWVRADLRGRGIGRELMARAEARARERGCHSAWLDTWSFQAPWFYPKLGYEVFGTLDYPPDQTRFFLKKSLLGREAADADAS